jgi:hypothetical protein
MRHTILFLAGILAAASAPVIAAETSMNFGMTGGYIDNLFLDSGKIHDSYTTPYLSVRLYPSSSLELVANGSYTGYRETPDLGSILLGGSVSYVMMNDNQPFSLLASCDLSARRYGDLYRNYDNIHAGASLIVRYRLTGQAFLKAGAALTSNEYTNTSTGNNRGYGLFTGLTATILGSNSLDLEAGYDRTQFPNLAADVSRRQMMHVDDPETEEQLRTVYYSFRLSRPMASHTGIGLQYAARRFVGDNNAITYGLSLDNLSPWTAFWEGQAISADIKSFVIPNIILTSSAEYRDISFMDALESSSDSYYIRSRSDHRTTASLAIARPIVIRPGSILQPSISAEYIANRSTDPFSDYNSFSIALTLGLQM